MKNEIKRIKSLGAISRVVERELAAPTFGRPKKTRGVRICTDFWAIDAAIQRSL